MTLETKPVPTMILKTNPVLTLILVTCCVLKVFLSVRKDEVTFLDVQTDGVTLPVPGSSSSFSLGSVVVVGSLENQCRDDHMSESLVNSPVTKRLMEIAVASGASVRAAYKTVRKSLLIEARRQKELDGGVEPEVVLDSFLR